MDGRGWGGRAAESQQGQRWGGRGSCKVGNTGLHRKRGRGDLCPDFQLMQLHTPPASTPSVPHPPRQRRSPAPSLSAADISPPHESCPPLSTLQHPSNPNPYLSCQCCSPAPRLSPAACPTNGALLCPPPAAPTSPPTSSPCPNCPASVAALPLVSALLPALQMARPFAPLRALPVPPVPQPCPWSQRCC